MGRARITSARGEKSAAQIDEERLCGGLGLISRCRGRRNRGGEGFNEEIERCSSSSMADAAVMVFGGDCE